VTGLLALTTAAIFFGAAIYVSVVEHPARMGLNDQAALAQWKPAYARGAVMQASLAILAGLLGIAAWWLGGNWLWLVGAAAILANWPFTLIVIMSVNRGLKAASSAGTVEGVRGLLIRWGHLHAGRSFLGALATILFIVALG
jgi:hypothetical protein